MRKYVSVDIGGTNIKYGVVSGSGEVLYSNVIATDAVNGGENLIKRVTGLIKSLLDENSGISGIGISTAGVVNTLSGEVIYASANLPAYAGTQWKRIIKEQFNIKCSIQNDVNAAALAEAWLGAGKGRSIFFCLTLGTGIGGAAFIDGKLYKGVNFRAAEIGYLNINSISGNFEENASTRSLVERVKNELNCDNLNGMVVFERARSGGTDYNHIIDLWVNELSKGISNIVYLFDPGLIIIGGGVSNEGEYLLNKIYKGLKHNILSSFMDGTELKMAECGANAGIIGAVYDLIKQNGRTEQP
jgi:glucokinase